MESAHEYLERAAKCERLAEDARSASMRNMLFAAAKYWRRLAATKTVNQSASGMHPPKSS